MARPDICCGCDCVPVDLEARTVGAGWTVIGSIRKTLRHTEDCFSQAADFITSDDPQFKVRRHFSYVKNGGEFTITVLGGGGSGSPYDHVGWQVIQVDGTRDIFQNTDPITITLTSEDAVALIQGQSQVFPPPEVMRVQALFRGGEIEEELDACDNTLFELPARLLLTLPPTLDFSPFNLGGSSGGHSAFRPCVSGRESDVYNRIESADIVLKCDGVIGQRVNYSWKNGAGSCAKIVIGGIRWVATGFLPLAHAPYEIGGLIPDPYSSYPENYTCVDVSLHNIHPNQYVAFFYRNPNTLWLAVATVSLELVLKELSGRDSVVSMASDWFPISSYVTRSALMGMFRSLPEHTSECGSEYACVSSSGLSFGGISDSADYIPVNPLTRYPSLNGNTLPAVSGLLNLSLNGFYSETGTRERLVHHDFGLHIWREHCPFISQSSNRPGPAASCPSMPNPTVLDVISMKCQIGTAMSNLFPHSYYFPCGPLPTNLSFPISLQVTSDSAENQSSDCRCLASSSSVSPKTPMMYVAQGQVIDNILPCTIECSQSGVVSDVFPRFLTIILPDTLDLQFRDDFNGTTLFPNTLVRRPELSRGHVLTTNCNLATFQLSNAMDPNFFAPWFLNQPSSSADIRGVSMEYRHHPVGQCPNSSSIILDVGWVNTYQPVPCGLDAVPVARLFTMCRINPYILGNIVTIGLKDYEFVCINLGPEFIISDFSTDEIQNQFALLANPFGWDPDFVFTSGFAMKLSQDVALSSAHLPFPLDFNPPQTIAHDYSIHPAMYYGTRAHKIYQTSLSQFCPGWESSDCSGGPDYGKPFSAYCGSLGSNHLLPFRVYGKGYSTILPAQEACQPATNFFISYEEP